MEEMTTTTPDPAEAFSSPVLNSSSLPPSGVLMISRVMLRAYLRAGCADSRGAALPPPALAAPRGDGPVGAVQEARHPDRQALPRPDGPLVQLAGHQGELDRRHRPGQLPARIREVSGAPAAAEHQRGGGQFR